MMSLRLLTFAVDRFRMAIPVRDATQLLRAPELAVLPGAPDCIKGLIDFHGVLVPVGDIRARLGLEIRPVGLGDHVVLVKTLSRLLGLIAEGDIDVIEIAQAQVTPATSLVGTVRHIGGLVQVNGELILIQDAEMFLLPDEDRQLDEALREHA